MAQRPAQDLPAYLRSFRPQPLVYRGSDYLRAALGSLLGLLVAAWTAQVCNVGPAGLPFIVAPMGASAVLLFAAPASPLAQPWPVVGGNIISSLVGVITARLVSSTAFAAAIAVAAAIAIMIALRCLHPPGGACALFAATASPVVHHQGLLFAVFPVAIDTVFLLLVALAVNNLTGRRYPHQPPATPPAADTPAGRVGLRLGDITDAIARLDQGLDIHPGDVLALVHEAEVHAVDRQLGQLVVRTVMETNVATVQAFETVYRVRLIFSYNHVKAVPVLDAERHVIGIITIYDLFRLKIVDLSPAESIMSSPVTTVRDDTPVAHLVRLMTEQGLRHIPVVDAEDRLVGIVTRTELIAVLNRVLVAARQEPGSGLPV